MTQLPMHLATAAPALRRISLLALLAFLPTACASWRSVTLTEVVRGDEQVDNVELRFRLPGDPRRWHLQVQKVELPFVLGIAWSEEAPAPADPSDGLAPDASMAAPARPELRRVDLRHIEEMEIYSLGRTLVFSGLLTVAGVGAFVAIMVLSPGQFKWGSQQPTPWSPGPRR